MLELAFQQLGLREYEALIYVTLLQNSPASASLLAKKAGLSRSSVYTVLSSLTAKGLVGTSYKNEVKQFVAEGYESLERLIKSEQEQATKRVEILESMKTQIQGLTGVALNIPQVVSFEGKEGLKRIYSAMLRQASEGSTMYVLRDEFVWEDEWKFVFEEDWHNKVKRLQVEKDIQTKLLINDSALERSKQAFYKSRKGFEYRVLPKGRLVEAFALYLVDDTVSILSMENKNLVGIQITNQHLATNFKEVFEGLWNSGKKP